MQIFVSATALNSALIPTSGFILFITQLQYKGASTTLKYVLLRLVKNFSIDFGDPVGPWLRMVLVCIVPQSLGKIH